MDMLFRHLVFCSADVQLQRHALQTCTVGDGCGRSVSPVTLYVLAWIEDCWSCAAQVEDPAPDSSREMLRCEICPIVDPSTGQVIGELRKHVRRLETSYRNGHRGISPELATAVRGEFLLVVCFTPALMHVPGPEPGAAPVLAECWRVCVPFGNWL